VEDGRQRVEHRVEEGNDVRAWNYAVKTVPWKQKGKKGGRVRRGDNVVRREKAKEIKYGTREVRKIERAVSEKGEERVVVVEMRGRSQSMAERRVKGWSEA